MTATELINALRETNGNTIHVLPGIAFMFLDELKQLNAPVELKLEFHDNNCTITWPVNERKK